MKKTKGVLILSTAVLSGISSILCFVALGTQYWIVSDATVDGYRPSNVNYGLFSGTLTRNLETGSPRHFDLTMTCVNNLKICALSCLTTSDKREKEVKDLYNGLNTTFGCVPISRGGWEGSDRHLNYKRTYRAQRERIFIDNDMYLSTLAFVILAAIFAVASAAFSVLNTATNPIEPWFNVLGIHVYNGIASICLIITLALWGAEYGERISKNIAIHDTLVGHSNSEKQSNLGFSYWILLVAFLMHISNNIILVVRKYLIDREPATPNVGVDDKADGQIMLY